MDKINKDWELLKPPLSCDKYSQIVNANDEIVAKMVGSSDTAENNFVGNYIAESVNSRRSARRESRNWKKRVSKF